ncbi:MAG: hypothetical protein HKP48_00810 [Winogradskyella sp.]|uniref:TolB family protein n=1 Tax=Winogradskyella sp. TaxID=1883156 RepID=UPI0017BE16DC|nr:hypothetical protein [Winogradskyella sp.]MBT8244566.1 PD40 domain-containing protein [Winogradskyella sp.]NNK21857.1 hypothetical protein [Winogradskyella sp.]
MKLHKSIGETSMALRSLLIIVLCLMVTICFSQDIKIKIKNIKLNNKLDHFSAMMNNGNVYFSQNLTNKRGKPIKNGSKTFIYSLIKANLDKQGEIINMESIKKTKLGMVNMSVSTFSKDGKYMYFTTNSVAVGVNKRKDFKTFNLQIQRAEYIEGKGWTNFIKLPFCNNNYSYAHPALSPDGNTLYFVSNIKGTKGRTDIYKVSVSGHQNYGEPVRLSRTLNSYSTELYPFVSNDNKIYFSSNRRGGFGGYDIYSYDLNTADETIIPEVLPKPINSIGEDFSFFLMDDGKRGFLTSRRTKGKGNDDIYYFTGF